MSAALINREKALIFRITHRANVPWIAANGLHCAMSQVQDPAFRPIGNAELISRRRHRALPPPYDGMLSDYVPFYFTPYSPMMYNIHTGYGGIEKQRNEDIVILVSSIARLGLGNGFAYAPREHHVRRIGRPARGPSNRHRDPTRDVRPRRRAGRSASSSAPPNRRRCRSELIRREI
ncbi:DUF4433 domain-containing protein [Sphingomonas sp. MM-1]|uniref:DUF4433 domain-containing protein n=1 Tax=Sphingomonas sp. MM-1 TaxID=745310 RepID=UPI0011835755|nr:DUF4433 domain-containing protein [Sphingomonas sp. MM-1]